jgi:uncharacterized damage-inducible protein DinB
LASESNRLHAAAVASFPTAVEIAESMKQNERAPVMPMDTLLPYRAMAHNNAWANHRLLTACAGLSPEEFTARRVGFFPNLRATLNHILVIDRFYVDAMEGGTLGPAAWTDREPCGTVAALRPAQAEIDRRLLAIVGGLDEEGLSRIVAVHRATLVQHERMDRLLLHLFQHQIHHRGQAHAMLSDTSVPPPQLDEFFSAGEAPLRAEEFNALGWTEETVWAAPCTGAGSILQPAPTSAEGAAIPNRVRSSDRG